MKIFLFLLMTCTFCAAQTPPSPKQSYTAALFSRGSRWDTTKAASAQPYFAAHGRNLKRLRENGKIALGARYSGFGLVVFKTGDQDEVRTYFAEDSLVNNDYLRMELHPFLPFYPGSIE
jgi:hypothetical protein